MQLNGGITHPEQAELASQVQGRPGEGGQGGRGEESHPGGPPSCPQLLQDRSMLGSGNEVREAGGSVTGRQRLQLFYLVAWSRSGQEGLCAA